MSPRAKAAPGLTQVRHDFDPPLIPGRLIRRYKRFLAEVELEDGRIITAHCPNSGSMLGCIADHAPVYLSHHPDPKRRTAYTWEMIHIGGDWVGINTGLPNRLVAQAARMQALPLFAGVTEVRTEVRVNQHSRLDLLVQRPQGPLYVEVKNVTLTRDGVALFPDAVTTRGAKHLRELMALKAQGLDAAMVYVVQRSDADSFAPATAIDPEYARGLEAAIGAGVGAVVVQAQVAPRAVWLTRELPLG